MASWVFVSRTDLCMFVSCTDGLHGNLLAVADEEGSVRLMDTRRRLSDSLITELSAHRNAIFDIAWLPGGTRLVG